jgi:hypothetical protein
LAVLFVLAASLRLWAATGGSISGTVADSTGARIPGAALRLVNIAQQTAYRAVTDSQGLYSFPNLPVGHYDLTISVTSFTTQRKTNLAVDTDSALRVDATLAVRSRLDSVTVTTDIGVGVDTIATPLGEVISSEQKLH